MTVERIVIVGDKSSKVYVTLTDAELCAAYNEQKLRFLLSDAQDRLREYCGLEGDVETNRDYEFNGLRLLLGTDAPSKILRNSELRNVFCRSLPNGMMIVRTAIQTKIPFGRQ